MTEIAAPRCQPGATPRPRPTSPTRSPAASSPSSRAWTPASTSSPCSASTSAKACILRNAGGRVTDDVLRSLRPLQPRPRRHHRHRDAAHPVRPGRRHRRGAPGRHRRRPRLLPDRRPRRRPAPGHRAPLAAQPYLSPITTIAGFVYDVETGHLDDVIRWERPHRAVSCPAPATGGRPRPRRTSWPASSGDRSAGAAGSRPPGASSMAPAHVGSNESGCRRCWSPRSRRSGSAGPAAVRPAPAPGLAIGRR